MQSLSFLAVFLATFIATAMANSSSESPVPQQDSPKTTPTSPTTETVELMNNDAPQQTGTPEVLPTKIPNSERPSTTPPPLVHESIPAVTTQMPPNNIGQSGKVEAANTASDTTKDPKSPKKKGSGATRINSELMLVGAVVLLVGGLFA